MALYRVTEKMIWIHKSPKETRFVPGRQRVTSWSVLQGLPGVSGTQRSHTQCVKWAGARVP